MTTITVTWQSGGKEVKVEVECQDSTLDWATSCAKKVKDAVDAMEKLFPPDEGGDEPDRR